MSNLYNSNSNQSWAHSTSPQQNQPHSQSQLDQYNFGIHRTQRQPQGHGQPSNHHHQQFNYPIMYPPNNAPILTQSPSSPQFVRGHVSPTNSTHSNASNSYHQAPSFPSTSASALGVVSNEDPSFDAKFDAIASAVNPNTFSSFGNRATYDFSGDTSLGTSHQYQADFTMPSHAPYSRDMLQPEYYQHSNGKRARIPDEDESKSEALEDSSEQSKEGQAAAKAKAGACARCKNLKVRCEFMTETDPCKRCSNGGHECVIPGRKKRRTPPKREHLLNQIRDQAEQIQKLMSQLEENSKTTHTSRSTTAPTTNGHSSNGSDIHSPQLSPSSAQKSYFTDADSNAVPEPDTPKDVLDWLAKARESIQAFGGYIGLGGAGMPKSALADDDSEDSDGDEEASVAADGDEEYGFAVVEHSDLEHEDVRETHGDRIHKRGSVSSFGTAGLQSLNLGPKKKQSFEDGLGANEKMAILPGEATPFGLMAKLALKKNRRRGSDQGVSDQEDGAEEPAEEEGTGIANDDFFRPSPGPDPMRIRANVSQQQAPHILTRNIITPEEAEKLFAIYFDNMNMSVSLLDPVLYTAQKTCWRSPFLFTVICAIASRFYSARPEIYQQAMHYAHIAAGNALISGHKSVEVCQAYILLSLYPVPARRWEDDRNWLYLGLAIRIATELNLHLPNTAKPINELHAREMLNRTRVWLNCFNLDRSMGSQYGKSAIIKHMDYVACNSETWWDSSEYNLKNFDVHLCVYNNALRVTSGFQAKVYSDPRHPTGLNKEVDFEQVATETDEELKTVGDKWFAMLDKTDMSDPQNCFRIGLLRLAFSYQRLIVLSFGFQHAFGKNNNDENPFLMRCLRAATDVVNTVVHNIGRPTQRKYLRHGPEAQSVFVTFACAFLVKLLQPKFASYLSVEQRLEIRGLVKSVIDLLGSPEVAIDNKHGPKLYARFLKGLLATPMARVESDPTKPSTPRSERRPKSSSPECERRFDTPGPVDHPSPATSLSMSPPPSTLAIPFDQFAPVTGGVDPLVPVSSQARAFMGPMHETHDMPGMNMSFNDFFQPPLPFDPEILQTMQSFNDPMWADLSLPAINWVSQYQNNDDVLMDNNNDPLMYDSAQFTSPV